MAKNNEAKVRFTAETGDLNKAIASSNSELTKLRSELKLNEAQAKSTGDSMDSLKDRARILGEEYQASQSKVDALSDKLEAARNIFGENSTEVQKLETQLNNARTAQERIAQQIDQTNAAMADMESASSQAESALGKLGSEVESQENTLRQLKDRYNEVAAEQGKNSTEARQLADQISKTSSELQENRTKLQQASSAADQFDKTLDDLGDSARDTGDDLSVMDVALGDFISDTAQNAIGAIAGLEESTRQYRNEQNKLEAVSIQTGQSLEGLQQGYSDLYAITGDETLASTAVLNMSAMGVSVEDQARLVDAATGAWAAYGDSIPLDGLLESINETTRAGQVTGSFADALNWAAMSNDQWSAALSGHTKAQEAFNKGIADGMNVEDAFNEALAACADTGERQQLVTEAMEAAYGELGDTYQETNADVIEANDASRKLADAQAELSEAIAPVTTGLTNLKADALQWLADNLPTIIPLVTGLAVAVGGLFIVQQVATGFSAFSGAITAVKTGLTLLLSPAGLVVAAIAALVAGFMWAYENIEPFRTAIDGLVQMFQETFGPVLQQVGDLINQGITVAFQFLSDFITTYVVPALQAFGEFLQTTVFPVLQQWGQWISENVVPALQNIWTWLGENILPILQSFADFVMNSVIPTLQQIAQWIMDNVVPALQSFWGWFQQNILPILQDFWNFVQTSVIPALGDLASWIANDVVPAVQDMWDWFSTYILPVLEDVASFIINDVVPVLGQIASFILEKVVPAVKELWQWFEQNILPVLKDVWDTVGDGIEKFGEFADDVGTFISDAKETVEGGLDAISGFFSGLKIEFPHINLPHFTISGSFSLNPPSIPHIGVEWYAKGGILEEPTIFGARGNNLMVGGEAGKEVVAPLGDLLGYMIEALDSRFAQSDGGALIDAIEALASRPVVVSVNGRELALATASDTDRVSGSRQNLVRRGVSLA